MNAPHGETIYNPELVQSALRNAIQQFQQQTLSLSESAGSAISSPEGATSPTSFGTTPGYYRHSRHSSLASSAFNTKRRKIIAFDLYGTLLSTDSITSALAKIYGEEAAPGIAKLWRRFQLEYTWRITSMGEYKNFHEITRSALGHALMEHSGIHLTAKDAKELMHAYEGLDAYPDVERGLNMLRDARMEKSVKHGKTSELKMDKLSIHDGKDAADAEDKVEDDLTPPEEVHDIDTFIFTNGTEDMVYRSIATSPTLSPHARRTSSSPLSSSSSSSKSRSPSNSTGLFSAPESIVTVDSVQCYKPDPRCYKHLMEVAGVRTEADRRNVWLVSANPFDIVGAKAAGMRAAWIDREGKGWVDRLDEMRVPSVTATGVDEAIKAILSWK